MNISALPSAETGAAVSRRHFLKHSSLAVAGAAAVTELPFVLTSHAAPDDPIRIGVIGCGGRGTGAVLDALGAATKVIYPKSGYHTEDMAEGADARQQEHQSRRVGGRVPGPHRTRAASNSRKLDVTVSRRRCVLPVSTAYKQLLAVPEINYVILATPPHFRPSTSRPPSRPARTRSSRSPWPWTRPGVRMVLEAGELAKQKKPRHRRRHPAPPPAAATTKPSSASRTARLANSSMPALIGTAA